MVSQPSPPDPYATAAAQNAQNQSASQYNSVSNNANEINPYGTVSYKAIEQVPIYTNGQISGYAPRYQRSTVLSPDQQKLLGLETQAKYNMGTAGVEQSAKLREHLNTSLSKNNWQGWQTGLTTQPLPDGTYNVNGTYNNPLQDMRQDQTPTDRASVEKAMMDSYNRNTRSAEDAQEASLAARGLSPGGQGYGGYQMQRDDSRAEAARNAYLASGDESRKNQDAFNTVAGARFAMGDTAEKARFDMANTAATTKFGMENAAATNRFNMDKSLAEYYNAMRQGQVTEDIALRNQPINEITALMQGGQATIPQFQPYQGSPINPSNIGQYISDNYKAESASAAQTNAGIFSMIGGLAKMMPMM